MKTKECTVVKQEGPRLQSTERDCPRCESTLFLNEKEECYECLSCGFIDCGED